MAEEFRTVEKMVRYSDGPEMLKLMLTTNSTETYWSIIERPDSLKDAGPLLTHEQAPTGNKYMDFVMKMNSAPFNGNIEGLALDHRARDKSPEGCLDQAMITKTDDTASCDWDHDYDREVYATHWCDSCRSYLCETCLLSHEAIAHREFSTKVRLD